MVTAGSISRKKNRPSGVSRSCPVSRHTSPKGGQTGGHFRRAAEPVGFDRAQDREKVEWKFGMFVDWRLARAVEELQNSGEKLTPAKEEVIRKVKAEEPLTTAELRLIGARNAERPIARSSRPST